MTSPVKEKQFESDLDDEEIASGIDEEIIEPTDAIYDPFDPTLIRVERSSPTIALLARRIQHEEINLAPDFQRRGGIWNQENQSRLIESILIRIPLPAIYVDATDENCWLVVDGLQRLSTLKNYVIDETFELTGLEFLHNLTGMKFSDLPRNLQRRIEETEITVFQIQPGTPAEVKFNIFKRINTGGLPLSAQEIRNAINGDRVRTFIKELAESDAFKKATRNSIGDQRMADRECVTRFLAFYLSETESYTGKDFDNFLNLTMARIDDPEKTSDADLAELAAAFYRGMDRAMRIFGKHAFRKYYGEGRRLSQINKALFETVGCGLARLDDSKAEALVGENEAVLAAYQLLNNDADFTAAISQGTGNPDRIRRRFHLVTAFLDSVAGGA